MLDGNLLQKGQDNATGAMIFLVFHNLLLPVLI